MTIVAPPGAHWMLGPGSCVSRQSVILALSSVYCFHRCVFHFAKIWQRQLVSFSSLRFCIVLWVHKSITELFIPLVRCSRNDPVVMGQRFARCVLCKSKRGTANNKTMCALAPHAFIDLPLTMDSADIDCNNVQQGCRRKDGLSIQREDRVRKG